MSLSKPWVAGLAFLLWNPASAGEGETRAPRTSFFRLVYQRNDDKDAGRWIGQSSVRELRHPESGASVVLLSLVHTGTAEYYRSLTPHLRDAEVVLAEGTGGQPPGKRLKDEELPPEGLWVRRYLSVTARILDLEQQWRWEASVVDPRWVMADMDTKQLAAAMQEHSVTLLPDELKAVVTRLETLMAGPPTPDELARARAEVQVMEWNVFSRYTGPTGGEARVQQLREEMMWRIIKEQLTSGRHKRVALVFGGSHAYNLEARLVGELGYRLEAISWHDCQVFERTAKAAEETR